MGLIQLEGMEFFSHHGYYDEERKIGNKYSVDLEVELDFSEAAANDNLSETANYETLYAITAKVMGETFHLLEHIADNIISEIKSKFPEIKRVRVKVSKHNPPIKGLCKLASVVLEK